MKPKPTEGSVSEEIIKKVHDSLTDLQSGGPTLEFLRSTEPVFIEEVHRFINSELSRMKENFSEAQSIYLGSIIGACYISGFLICREANNKMFEGLIGSPQMKHITVEEFDQIADKGLEEGKTYKEISQTVHEFLKTSKPKAKVIKKKEKESGGKDQFHLGDLA